MITLYMFLYSFKPYFLQLVTSQFLLGYGGPRPGGDEGEAHDGGGERGPEHQEPHRDPHPVNLLSARPQVH